MGLIVALSETTTSLLAALLGAIVGGIATLGGSMVINRWDRSMDARLRMYEQLIPRANSLLAELLDRDRARGRGPSEWDPEAGRTEKELAECYEAIQRACVVAGRPERRWRRSSPNWNQQEMPEQLVLLDRLLARRIH